MNREIKFEYGFTNHAPVVFTLSEIQGGNVKRMLFSDAGSVKYRRQYTGLKDKNGTSIFEGDIISTPLENICLIKWDTVSMVIENDRFEYTGFVAEHLGVSYHLDRTITDGKIVGNIYQNPELPEQEVV